MAADSDGDSGKPDDVLDWVTEMLAVDGGFRHHGTALWERADGTVAAASWPIRTDELSIPSDLGHRVEGNRAAIVIHMKGSESPSPDAGSDDAVRIFIPGEHESPRREAGEDVYDVVAIDTIVGSIAGRRVRVSYQLGGVDFTSEETWNNELVAAVMPFLLSVMDSPEEALSGALIPLSDSQLASPHPRGWLAKESLTLTSPGGGANVIVSSEPVEPGAEIETLAYAELNGQLLLEECPEFHETSLGPIYLQDGSLAYVRDFTWSPPDSPPIRQIQLYYVEGERGYTATATTSVESFARFEKLFEQVFDGLVFGAA